MLNKTDQNNSQSLEILYCNSLLAYFLVGLKPKTVTG